MGGAASAAGGGWNAEGAETLEMLQCCDRWSGNAGEGVRGRSAGNFLFRHGPGHSIPRPIAFGNRVPPQRTVLRETTVTPDFTIYARRLLGKYNLCTVQRLAALGTALQPERAADFAALSELAEQLDADGVCCRVSQLAVNGRDLMAAGVPAGPGIRKVLEALLDGVIREEYPNERQALLAAVQQLAAS